ncbi:MAG: phytanoyl-CoA dioxygenase family protein [Gammaproteobacteria bacterium]|nr:phytanoyl-CoA dioxygenase family protein [Gammaproteobacteria bacterium]
MQSKFEAMQSEFEANGYYILRGVLTEEELEQLASPIKAAFSAGDYDTFHAGPAYPAPGIHSMGPRVLEEHPEIADVSLAHPAIMEAVEALLGEPATLGQYWSIMRPPGAGLDDKPFVKGSGAHYDYKPWRCVGSYVKWLFAVIPFVDYTETAGPLVISPGSHLKTRVLPSDGRVHPVDAALVPAPESITLVDPKLKRGDVVLMHGFAWHEARPNYGNSDRAGLYMKFHAKSSPPACGPTIYPSAVHDALRPEARHLVPYHRGDGKYAAVREGPIGGVDEARLVIEDPQERLLLVRAEGGRWRLPGYTAAEDETARILDVCNVMGSVVTQVHVQLGLKLPWLSWLVDVADTRGNAEVKGEEWRCRVYGHRLSGDAQVDLSKDEAAAEHCWVTVEELEQWLSEDLIEDGEQVRKWLHMWQAQEDEDGQPVTRSFGVPTTHVKYYSYNGNGNPEGICRIGDFDAQGLPVRIASTA